MAKKTVGRKIRCSKCHDVIQSQDQHDMVWCECKEVAVDGGSTYLRVMNPLCCEKMVEGRWVPLLKEENK